jgi:cyclic dehypoxanthinyl futalosine synthase
MRCRTYHQTILPPTPIIAQTTAAVSIPASSSLNARETARTAGQNTSTADAVPPRPAARPGRWATAVADRIHGDKPSARTSSTATSTTPTSAPPRCTFCAFKRDGRRRRRLHAHRDAAAREDAGARRHRRHAGAAPGRHAPRPAAGFYTEMLAMKARAFPADPPARVQPAGVRRVRRGVRDRGLPHAPSRAARTSWPRGLAGQAAHIMRRLMRRASRACPAAGRDLPRARAPTHRPRARPPPAVARRHAHRPRAGHAHVSATMMFGHIEGIADRIMHMQMIRDAQDRPSPTNWPGPIRELHLLAVPAGQHAAGSAGQHDRNRATRSPAMCSRRRCSPASRPARQGRLRSRPSGGRARQIRLAGSNEYLRTQAISRLFMDNIHSIGKARG